MFETQTLITMDKVDAAGVVFFANHFKIAHVAYEAFMKSIGCGLDKILEKSDFLLPVVHAEADYKKALCLGDELTIALEAEVRNSSFMIAYTFTDGQGNVAAQLKTVHASIDIKTRKIIPMPEDIKKGLATLT
jgi:YbgC/YbaW family acyl-CoA thioester hydrolase